MPELLSSLPAILKALQRGKVTPAKALLHSHKADDGVKRIYKAVHDREERYELNLYVVGEEDEPDRPRRGGGTVHADAGAAGTCP